VKLDKDQHHGLGITIAGYTDQTGICSCFVYSVLFWLDIQLLAV